MFVVQSVGAHAVPACANHAGLSGVVSPRAVCFDGRFSFLPSLPFCYPRPRPRLEIPPKPRVGDGPRHSSPTVRESLPTASPPSAETTHQVAILILPLGGKPRAFAQRWHHLEARQAGGQRILLLVASRTGSSGSVGYGLEARPSRRPAGPLSTRTRAPLPSGQYAQVCSALDDIQGTGRDWKPALLTLPNQSFGANPVISSSRFSWLAWALPVRRSCGDHSGAPRTLGRYWWPAVVAGTMQPSRTTLRLSGGEFLCCLPMLLLSRTQLPAMRRWLSEGQSGKAPGQIVILVLQCGYKGRAVVRILGHSSDSNLTRVMVSSAAAPNRASGGGGNRWGGASGRCERTKRHLSALIIACAHPRLASAH